MEQSQRHTRYRRPFNTKVSNYKKQQLTHMDLRKTVLSSLRASTMPVTGDTATYSNRTATPPTRVADALVHVKGKLAAFAHQSPLYSGLELLV